MVHLGKNLGMMRLLHAHTANLPPWNIYSVDYEESIVAELLDFTRNNRIKCDNVVLGLPRKEIILRDISLPPVEKEDLRQIIEFEIERHIPFPSSEVYFDFHLLKKESDDDLCVLLVAVRRETVDFYVKLLDSIRLSCSVVDITSFSTYGMLTHMLSRQKKVDTASGSLMIDIGNVEVEINLLVGDQFIASRGLTKEKDIESRVNLIIENKNSFEDNLGLEGEMSPEDIEMSQQTNSLVEFLEEKSDELLKGHSQFNFFGNINNQIFLFGSETGRPNFANFFEKQVDTKVSLLNPLEAFNVGTTKNGLESQGLSCAFALALRGMVEYPIQFNFLPSLISSDKKQKNTRIVTAILLALALVLGGVNLIGGYIKERIMLKEVNQKIEEIKPLGDKAIALTKEARKLSIRKKEIEEFRSHKIWISDLLLELTEIIPKTAWIEKLNLDKNELEIIGYADSASSLISILEASSLFEDVKFTSSITIRGLEKEKFKMKAKLEGKEIENILDPRKQKKLHKKSRKTGKHTT